MLKALRLENTKTCRSISLELSRICEWPVPNHTEQVPIITWDSRRASPDVEGGGLKGIDDVVLCNTGQVILIEEGALEASRVDLCQDHLQRWREGRDIIRGTERYIDINRYIDRCTYEIRLDILYLYVEWAKDSGTGRSFKVLHDIWLALLY